VSHNIRFQEVAINQTAAVIVSGNDCAKLQFLLVRRVTGTLVETVTVISNGVTLFDIKATAGYDTIYCFYGIDTYGLKISTSAQAHAWVGVYAEANKGVHPDRV